VRAEDDASQARRRRVVAATAVTGAGLLGVSLSTRPDSREFYGLTLGVASVWTIGGLISGPLHLGHDRSAAGELHRPVVEPIATGVGAFAAFYSGALVARRIPVLDRALRSVLQYAREGSNRSVMVTTLANGVAEEVFFRGALYAAIGPRRPVTRSTAAYVVATSTTRNPALVLASAVMGLLFSAQRRATGGIQASTLTHLTWSALMIRFLPPLFQRGPDRPRRPRGRG
jgi:uncharacterized protein